MRKKEIEFANGLIPGLESMFPLERCRFDGILLEHAQSLGAEVRREITVEGLVPSDDHITATLAARVSDAASSPSSPDTRK